MQSHGLQHTRLPCPSLFPGVGSNSCSWIHQTISSSVTPFSSCPQIFPSIRVFSSESVLPMNIQGWFPLGLTGLIFLMSKGLSRVFSSTTVRKHQFFGSQLQLSGCKKKPYDLLCKQHSHISHLTHLVREENCAPRETGAGRGKVGKFRTASRTQFCHLSSGSREWTWVAQAPFRAFD